MAEIINLRQARKARDRAATGAKADSNRARFGRGKAEKHMVEDEAARIAKTLDGAKLEE